MIISALLTLVEKLLPKLAELRDGGNITKETQASIRARYDKLAGNMDEEFGGDHWKIRPDPLQASTDFDRSGMMNAAPLAKTTSAKSTGDAQDCND